MTTVLRGCGVRVENGLYMTIPTSPWGMPLEHFLLDPPIKWGGGILRAPMLVPDAKGINHVLLGIGAESYPYFPDYFEEALRFGISKRIPLDFDPARLTFGKSKLLLMHPRAIPTFKFDVYDKTFRCPKTAENDPAAAFHHTTIDKAECISTLWNLSGLTKGNDKHHVQLEYAAHVLVKTPSVEYRVALPEHPTRDKILLDRKSHQSLKYESGLCLAFKNSDLYLSLAKREWDIMHAAVAFCL